MIPQFNVPVVLKPYQRHTQAAGVGLHYYEAGPAKASATPMLLIHGLGDEADSWQQVFEPISTQRRVLAPDLPGFGRSDHPFRAYTLDFFADTLAALLGKLHIPKAVLVGNSMGAAIALRMAQRHPALVERLVLVDGPPLRGKLSKAQLMFLLPGQGEKIYTGFRSSQDAAYDSLRPYYANLEALSPQLKAFLRERVWDRVWSDHQRRAYFSAFRWMAFEGLMGQPNAAGLGQIRVPTHIVWGDQDRPIPPEAGRLLQQWIPGSSFHLIANCGHLPQQEQPEAFLDQIKVLP